MGVRGQRYFEEADKLGGLVAKMRLASVAQVTSTEAATKNDSTELLERLEAALNRVKREFAPAAAAKPQASAPAKPGAVEGEVARPPEGTDLPRRCLVGVADLIAQRSLFVG